MKRDAPLWSCPVCGRPFANPRQPHSCGVVSVDSHLEGKGERAAELYGAFEAAVAACGPFLLAPARTRIGFQVRMIFAAVQVFRGHLSGHLVLARRIEHPRFTRIETFTPRCHAHHFRLGDPCEVDEQLGGWLREAYAVGEQRHLD